MAIQVTMPQAEQGTEEATILKWLVEEGQQVSQGQVLLEVETEKAVLEVVAPAGGTLRRILYQEGASAPVHAAIAIIAADDEEESEEP